MIARTTGPHYLIPGNALGDTVSLLLRAARALTIVGLAVLLTLSAVEAQSNPVAKKRSCERIAREFAIARKPVEGRKLDEIGAEVVLGNLRLSSDCE